MKPRERHGDALLVACNVSKCGAGIGALCTEPMPTSGRSERRVRTAPHKIREAAGERYRAAIKRLPSSMEETYIHYSAAGSTDPLAPCGARVTRQLDEQHDLARSTRDHAKVTCTRCLVFLRDKAPRSNRRRPYRG
jgi:hypothetical protein